LASIKSPASALSPSVLQVQLVKMKTILFTFVYFLASQTLAEKVEKKLTTNCNHNKEEEFFSVIDACYKEAEIEFFSTVTEGDLHKGACEHAKAKVCVF
jgi:hypothetical protein